MKLDPDIDPAVDGVLEAAALLDTTEFNIFCLAYARWFGQRATERLIEPYFSAYMFKDIVPPWVRHFTRQIIRRANQGSLKPEDYGLRTPPISARMILLGRFYATLLLLIVILLFLLTLGSEHLLVIAENCYFPPCY